MNQTLTRNHMGRTPLLAAFARHRDAMQFTREAAAPTMRQLLVTTRDMLNVLDKQPLSKEAHTSIRLQVQAIEKALA